MLNTEFAERFADAIVREIKAEMGRKGISSSRALGRIIGKTSQYMSDRLDGGSTKTGKRVILNAKDIAAIALALGVDPSLLVQRAEIAASTDGNITRGPWPQSDPESDPLPNVLAATTDADIAGELDGPHAE